MRDQLDGIERDATEQRARADKLETAYAALFAERAEQVAERDGRIRELEAALNAAENRCGVLQSERDASVSRVVEIETGIRGMAAQSLALLNAVQPHRSPAVEALIEQAARAPQPEANENAQAKPAGAVESKLDASAPHAREARAA
jgi:hypothetical protein